MTNNEYHKPFIRNLIFVAIITIVTMVISHYLINYYTKSTYSPTKTTEYSSQKFNTQQ